MQNAYAIEKVVSFTFSGTSLNSELIDKIILKFYMHKTVAINPFEVNIDNVRNHLLC